MGLCSLLPVAIHAQSLALTDAVERGLRQSYELEAAVADAEAAQATLRQARALLLPTFNSQASYTRLSDNVPEITVDFPVGPGQPASEYTLAPIELNQYYSQLSIEQPVFTGLRLTNRLKAAGHEARAATLGTERAGVDAAFRVRQAYWHLFRALAVRRAVGTALRRVEAHLRDVRNRRAVGAALESDVLTAQTRRAEVRLDSVSAANAVRVARLELNRLVGLPLGSDTVPADTVEVTPLLAGLDELLEEVLRSQPQLRALDEQTRALEEHVDAAQGTWLPDIYATARYVYARPNPNFFLERDQFHGTWEAGVTARWTLWNWGQRAAEVDEARAHLRQAEAQRSLAREETVVAVTRQYLEVQRAEAAVGVAGQSVEEARAVLRMLRDQYREGAALSSEVLDAEAAARGAAVRYAEALADYAVARAALLHAMGRVEEGGYTRDP